MKKLYGNLKLAKDELLESDAEYMELDYYKIVNNNSESTKKGGDSYGIEIIKNEYNKGEKITEVEYMNDITYNENVLDSLIKILKDNIVTPCTLKECVIEILKIKEVQN